ncbi:MAG: hypothetical protein NC548_57575 [Lachnospiraceae bacterium]|nr:hypothetical protein [Lachnospiraceae bacterium]
MKSISGIIVTAFALLLASCQKPEQRKVDTAQADAMYAELLATYKAYADSLQTVAAADTSGHLNRLISNFEQTMLEISKRYPPELDYKLTQLQNDSLYRYFHVYLKARSRIQTPPPVSLPDSLTLDSVTKDTGN